jgi:hypothetical protein
MAFKYFEKLQAKGILYTLWAIACFIGAAHEIMLECLQAIQKQEGSDGKKVLASWHSHMEHQDHRHFRRDFFERVVERADQASANILVEFPTAYRLFAVKPENARESEIRQFDRNFQA